MLELKSVTWKNFMSYGDYETKIDLDSLGQCLITGEVSDDDTKDTYDNGQAGIKKSNGAGKSTIPSVIQWCLFGRTMHSHNPGDKIINYYTGKDCVVTVEFKNGDRITRTRNTAGTNELIFTRHGDEHVLGSTMSTSKNQQAKLSKEFGLDWEIFCGSVFFNQYGKPWMEMADASRKKAIEKILHIDRFIYYAKVAKAKSKAFSDKSDKSRSRIDMLKNQINELEKQINRICDSEKTFAANQKARQRELLIEAKKLRTVRDEIILPDLDELKQKWDSVNKMNEIVVNSRQKLNSLISSISEKNGTKRSLENRINNWIKKNGKTCSECEQQILSEHITTKIDPIKESLDEISADIDNLVAQRIKIEEAIKKAEDLITKRKPSMSMGEANSIHRDYTDYTNNIERKIKQSKKVGDEVNPHTGSIDDIRSSINQINNEITKLEADIELTDLTTRHYSYIEKSYSDRNKIKSYVFQDHIPFINSRLNHYLDVFGLDVRIELTNSLSVTSNMWGYDFESGGERKRTDVAFMLAMFDFHEAMYGRQCNILVLDEVDGRLDDDGIDSLINIIKNDLAPKVETVFIISHRNMMFDTFSQELKVTRSNRFSHILEPLSVN